MTAEQKRRAERNNRVRPNKLIEAVEWLIANNEEWKMKNHLVNLDRLKEELRSAAVKPAYVNASRIVPGSPDHEGSNIERTDVFEIFFPDGTAESLQGGQKNITEFQELVREAQRHGYTLEMRCHMLKEAVQDFRDNNLVKACLLQFPYGRGGLHEMRYKGDGSRTACTDLEQYLQHLSSLAQPHFHQDLFCLIMYNMFMKHQMVRRAGLKLRGSATAHDMANRLTQADIDGAIFGRINSPANGPSRRGQQFLTAIDAIAGAIPHSNEAARRARGEADAHQHHFGFPSIFLTVAPDDDNSFLVQVFARSTVDRLDEDVTLLSDDELAARAVERTAIRIKYPGLCAFYFESVLNIIIREVVGWDLANHRATEYPGLFGRAIAVAGSVEEQGRATLHAHLQIWIEGNQENRENLHSPSRLIARQAKRKMEQFFDRVSSTALFATKRQCTQQRKEPVFQHECLLAQSKCNPPTVVDDQSLRILRHRVGQETTGRQFAYCQHCTKSWTNEELVESFLLNIAQIPGLTTYPDKVRRLKSMAVQYQMPRGPEVDRIVVDAAYNHHVHTKSCFASKPQPKNGNAGNQRKRKMPSKGEECRYRHPQCKKQRTTLQNSSTEAVNWYSWDGSFSKRFIKEIVAERHPYDVFQNTCCPAISHSKLTCNSNIAAVLPGPNGGYAFKYSFKGTQNDEVQRYKQVSLAMQQQLRRARRHESDRSESIRRLLLAAHSHQSTNVLHGTMGAYLVRRQSRFIFSHQTVWCPLSDIEKICLGEGVSTTVNSFGKVPFFQSPAHHYLCRPSALEDVSAYDFYSQYEVVRITKSNASQVMKFCNGLFQHPSYDDTKFRFFQGVKRRDRNRLVKVYQFAFPDTAEFKGCILDADTPITDITEKYSKLVLLLFYPFRHLQDICPAGSYTLQFREAVAGGIIDKAAQQFLQNLQDARSNGFRMSNSEDELQRKTKCFRPTDHSPSDVETATDNVDDEGLLPTLQGQYLDNLLDLLEDDAPEVEGGTGESESSYTSGIIPATLTLDTLRRKGRANAGYESLASMCRSASAHNRIWESSPVLADASEHAADATGDSRESHTPNLRDLGRLLLTRTRRRVRNFYHVSTSAPPVTVLEANGSVASILDWAKRAGLDLGQKRAFEICVGSFVQTFYSPSGGSVMSVQDLELREVLMKEKEQLTLLVENDKRGSEQLICLLHGPGGSGKTAVIDLLLLYAREFCEQFENFAFTSRTIIITDMSDVAATLLQGETMHGALYLNHKQHFKREDIEQWRGTQLLIIDEISFASKQDFEKIHSHLCRLKENREAYYGGINVIFAGDFRQLEPPGKGDKKAVYLEHCPQFQDWINCYLELNGMHRFRDDGTWGEVLLRFRDGKVTDADIQFINERVVANGATVGNRTPLPDDVRYGSYHNRERDAINAAVFQKRCEDVTDQTGHADDTILIYSSQLEVKDSTKVHRPLNNCKAFWEGCGEDDIKTSLMLGRMDPVLKLYRNCRVMLSFNKNVACGEANGTQALVDRVVLKHGVTPQMVNLGTTTRGNEVLVAAVLASQVERVVLQHCNSRVHPASFCVQPREYRFSANMIKPRILQMKPDERESVHMKGVQLPLLLNNATTGHKLQGSGVDTLFIHGWSKVTNWVYVMLSRVKTQAGLFCRKPLLYDKSEFKVPEALQQLMQKFEALRPTQWTEEEYEEMFGTQSVD